MQGLYLILRNIKFHYYKHFFIINYNMLSIFTILLYVIFRHYIMYLFFKSIIYWFLV